MSNTFLSIGYFFFITLLVACQSAPPAVSALGLYGAKIDESGAISIATILQKLEAEKEVETKLIGHVESVCQVKGCWMNLSDDSSDETVFVKFKDYGFFVPLDLSGQRVAISGKAFKEVTSVDELRHYAEDEGASKEEIAAITEPKEEFKFMATGVKVLK